MEHEMNQSCKDRFDKIDERLEKGDNEFKENGTQIIELKQDMRYISKSLDRVTKALWGVALSIGMALLGFFIWCVEQNLLKK